MVPTSGRPAALLDGAPADSVGATDRGLHYGDGLFETVAVVDGEPRLWARHVARLEAGAARLGLPMPPADALLCELRELIAGHERAVVKILYTRGEGGRGYRPSVRPRPHRLLLRYPVPDYPAEWWSSGVHVRFCETRLAEQPRLAGLKHLNRLEQVLARAEWSDPAVAEGLMLDNNGHVVEGTQTNLFAVLGDHLVTSPVDRSGVAGVMRGWVMEWASVFGVNCTEAAMAPEDLTQAREIFLTNSIIGVWPVKALAGQELPGRGFARELIASLRAARLCLLPE